MNNIEEIYAEYVEIVRKYLFYLTHNDDISEELTQETFYRAIKKIDSFKNNCKMSTWLCEIAKNLWYNELKKNKKMKNISNQEIEIIESEEKVENDVISKEKKLKLYNNIQNLGEDMRNVIYLRLTGELSFKEIGDILGKTENWARVVFYRAKKKLKECEDYE